MIPLSDQPVMPLFLSNWTSVVFVSPFGVRLRDTCRTAAATEQLRPVSF